MDISDIRISLVKKDSLLALCSCKVQDSIWLTGILVVEGSRGKFVAMPSRKDAKGEYQDVFFPAKREVREDLQTKLLKAYDAELAKEGVPA